MTAKLNIPKIKISILSLVLIAISFMCNCYTEVLIAYFSVLIHEIAHYYGCVITKVDVNSIKILPFGMTIELRDPIIKDANAQLLISAMGPMSNAIILIFTHLFLMNNPGYTNTVIDSLISSNQVLILVNILPVLPLDGGRILDAWFTDKWGSVKSKYILNKVSKFIVFLICIIFVLDIIFGNVDVSKLFVIMVVLFNIKYTSKDICSFTLSEIAASREKIKDNKPAIIKEIAVSEDTLLYSLFNNLSYNYFYVVNVVNRDNKIIVQYTETQIIDFILKHGNKIKFSDIITC